MRILVVEDTLLARTMLERSLRKWGYQVDSVSNISDAIQIIKQGTIQIVITDWIMPGGDGPTLCREIRALDLTNYTYIILVTSLEGSESATKGLEAGADDFIHKPVQLDELHARIRAGERVLALEKALNDRNAELQRAQDLINRDLETAAKMQASLLPVSSTKYLNVTIDWLFRPSSVVSGDIFNFFRLDETHVGFYSLDVAGHGVSSAMMSFNLFKLLNTEMQRGSPLKRPMETHPFYRLVSPSDVMVQLNSQFQTNPETWLYFTMIYGVIDTIAHRIEICQAGHPNPIYIANGESASFIGDGGFPIGITEAAKYENIVINYRTGDRLIIYSDGITECLNSNDEMFGVHRLLDFFQKNKTLPIQEIVQALSEQMSIWRGGKPYEDDISMLILEMS